MRTYICATSLGCNCHGPYFMAAVRSSVIKHLRRTLIPLTFIRVGDLINRHCDGYNVPTRCPRKQINARAIGDCILPLSLAYLPLWLHPNLTQLCQITSNQGCIRPEGQAVRPPCLKCLTPPPCGPSRNQSPALRATFH